MGTLLATALALLRLVSVGAWVAQSPASLPSSLPAAQARAPQPLIPFVVEGEFQTDGAVPAGGGGWLIVAQWNQSGSEVRGFKISLEGDKRLSLRIAQYDGLAELSCYSQQRNLDDMFFHRFVAVGTAESIQLSIDGLFGVGVNGGCQPGDQPGVNCGFGRVDSAADFEFGGGGCCPAQAFVGTIRGINIRRPETHELPRVTAADPNAAPSVAPASHSAGNEGMDILFFVILIPLLLIVGAVLLALGAWFACYLKKKHEEPPALAFGTMAAGATGPSVALAAATAGPAPLPAAIGAMTGIVEVGSSRSVGPEREREPIRTPASWSHLPSLGSSEMVEAHPELRGAIQALMDATWRDVITRDRSRGGSSSLQHFEVVQVLRNENTRLWHEYARSRGAIVGEMVRDDERIKTLTSNAVGLDTLDAECNESYLFHGSKPSSVKNICENDFLLKFAGARRGTLYGPGVYFAESSSKADEYADDDKNGIYKGLYAMLLCRVTLGRVFVTEEVRPNGEKLRATCCGKSATHHSVLGDREKALGTYREFVVFNGKQAYPEFIIVYRRSAPKIR